MTHVITGAELKRRRTLKRLTQAELGAILGVTASAVGQWETDKTKPDWKMAQAIEEFFDGVTPEDSTRVDAIQVEVAEIKAQMAELTAIVKRLSALFPPD